MDIVPAIDLRGGRVVRLAQGDYARQTTYDRDAADLAWEYAAAGARWLHVVDLDGARSGTSTNLGRIRSIAATPLRVQAGGGVRGKDDIHRLFDAGVARVVVGSTAVSAPDKVEKWISDYGCERICIALDTRRDHDAWKLAVHGWTEAAAVTLDELAPRFAGAGARHLLCTDIARDGMLSGPNLDLYQHLGNLAPTLQIQASGGVRNADDVGALRRMNLGAAILGRSLLEGRLTLAEVLQC
jgi:phosphoribosylformimino-5-aminoimidazole carboxamide ribotide isomerase